MTNHSVTSGRSVETQSQVDAARAYEALFVPALFGQWASRAADAAQVQPGQKVLDVACGTGVLAREASARTGPTGYVAGLDPGPGMLAVAKELAPSVDWRHGTAESMPFADGMFDAVVCQFGLMFFTDRNRAIHEMLRVTAPGGRMVLVVWDALDNIPAYAAEVALLERLAGAAAADALRAPFVLGDRQDLGALLVGAGAAPFVLATQRGQARFPSIRVMVEADLRGWLPVMGVRLADELVERILREAEDALGAYAAADGQASFGVSAHLATTVKA